MEKMAEIEQALGIQNIAAAKELLDIFRPGHLEVQCAAKRIALFNMLFLILSTNSTHNHYFTCLTEPATMRNHYFVGSQGIGLTHGMDCGMQVTETGVPIRDLLGGPLQQGILYFSIMGCLMWQVILNPQGCLHQLVLNLNHGGVFSDAAFQGLNGENVSHKLLMYMTLQTKLAMHRIAQVQQPVILSHDLAACFITRTFEHFHLKGATTAEFMKRYTTPEQVHAATNVFYTSMIQAVTNRWDMLRNDAMDDGLAPFQEYISTRPPLFDSSDAVDLARSVAHDNGIEFLSKLLTTRQLEDCELCARLPDLMNLYFFVASRLGGHLTRQQVIDQRITLTEIQEGQHANNVLRPDGPGSKIIDAGIAAYNLFLKSWGGALNGGDCQAALERAPALSWESPLAAFCSFGGADASENPDLAHTAIKG